MVFERFSEGVFITAWKSSRGIWTCFVSRPGKDKSDLLGIYSLSSNLPKTVLGRLFDVAGLMPLDAQAARELLPPSVRKYLSNHLLMGLDRLGTDEETLTADSAWKYEQLLDWGETSAVAILAQYQRVNVGTMRARLAQARLRGLLDSPGRGSRRL
jgi:hypothetical protein